MALPPLELFSLIEKATLLPGGFFVPKIFPKWSTLWISQTQFRPRTQMWDGGTCKIVEGKKALEPTTGVEPVTY